MPDDYKDTLNLPKTSFPMKANLAKRELNMLKFWEDIDIYEKLMEKRRGAEPFVLHDGPPYANGNIHIGTAFNKILKDMIPKYKWMRGYFAPYVPGWDTHGLPIELRTLKDEGLDKDSLDPIELRKKCMQYAERYIDVQRDEFKRLGVIGDWEDPYITFKPEYEAIELEAFAEMVDHGYVYRGQKPIYWCTDCQTALAAAEIEYEDIYSPSIYVAYSLNASDFSFLKGKEAYAIIWTTTPWTLPASLAIAVHPDFDYVFASSGDKIFLLAKGLIEKVQQQTGIHFDSILHEIKGKELEGRKAVHPFYDDREILFVLGEYVSLDEGSGCVHTAPGHGVEDFETGVRYGLEIYNPVDDRGYFTPETPLVGGLSLDDGSKKLMGLLRERGRLLGEGKIMHSYPHCWRCKKPVIFRATNQWFIAVSKFRDDSLKAISSVQWIPSWGQDRIANMVRDRSDWCISRQRIWGVPIPAFYCNDCGELILTSDRIRRVSEKVSQGGSDCWWRLEPAELLDDLAFCPKCKSKSLRKETDIFDVWFDSGTSHMAVLTTRPELKWPATMYLEGSDQHRGWFQTSLLTSVATRGRAPFEMVLTHGFIVDGEGRKMSKSLGNVVQPQEVIGKYGADILRLWVASTDYRNDIRISETILRNLVESYRRIRNTLRYILGNLSDFDPHKDSVPFEEMEEMDLWILSKLQGVISKVTKGFENFEFHVPTFTIHQLCVNELSAFYLDVNKDRLYVEASDSKLRRSCQTALWNIIKELTLMLSPILSFTSEEVWQYLRQIDNSLSESVFLEDWPVLDSNLYHESLEEKWDRILWLRGAVSRGLEIARNQDLIGQSLEACVNIKLDDETRKLKDLLSSYWWKEVFIVSDVQWVEDLPEAPVMHDDDETGVEVAIARAKGEKCPRCWMYAPEVSEIGLCNRCNQVLQQSR
ncbi:isoleucine--tRNA ligase [Acetomicrobium sp. UBA5826]|uniref:isoleucine--tRNA ligase n=1 Tax=Acetomicrobium sp. UBA5826 TaxID=1946039 RepID=UPI002579BA3E|nr:isoleucine--tRNA ligase [Acetomicrobium sp. UBA5826]